MLVYFVPRCLDFYPAPQLWVFGINLSIIPNQLDINVAGQLQEEDLQGVDLQHPCAEAQDVQLHRVEGDEDSLQAIRQSLLLRGN